MAIIIKEKPNPGWLVESEADWRKVCELLKKGQYGLVAEFLHQVQIASEYAGNAMLANTVAAIRQICLACDQYQSGAEWYRRAYEEADQREQELTQLLQTLFDLLGGYSVSRSPMDRTEILRSPGASFNLLEHYTSEAGKTNFLQRIQNLLGWGNSPRPQHAGTIGKPVIAGPVKGVNTTSEIVDFFPNEEEDLETPATKSKMQPGQNTPSLLIYCLGPFQVYLNDQPVQSWSNGKGKSIFKYLATHRERPVAKEVLMDLFWPDADPDAARNNLNVSIFSLRQTLRKVYPDLSCILFLDDCYLLNPELQIWVDVEEFQKHFRTAQNLKRQGEQLLAIRECRVAEALYQGEFLEEDRYEEWVFPQRQQLQADYLSLLDCLTRYYLEQKEYDACTAMCGKMLAVDPCHEEAHRRLMCCYSRQGQPYLALRQYHLCVEALKRDLDVPPTQATSTLYEQIRKGQQIDA